jgi:hypothetical protein
MENNIKSLVPTSAFATFRDSRIYHIPKINYHFETVTKERKQRIKNKERIPAFCAERRRVLCIASLNTDWCRGREVHRRNAGRSMCID